MKHDYSDAELDRVYFSGQTVTRPFFVVELEVDALLMSKLRKAQEENQRVVRIPMFFGRCYESACEVTEIGGNANQHKSKYKIDWAFIREQVMKKILEDIKNEQ